jgi:hypothetical protein
MKLLTKELLKQLPKIGETEKQEQIAIVKFFTPDGAWTWYGQEYDGEDLFYGLVDGMEKELGYFSLSELKSVRGQFGLPVERDLWFKPTRIDELMGVRRAETVDEKVNQVIKDFDSQWPEDGIKFGGNK